MSTISLLCALYLARLSVASHDDVREADKQPPVPAWPDQFVSSFYVYVEEYGDEWNSTGFIVYDWTSKV